MDIKKRLNKLEELANDKLESAEAVRNWATKVCPLLDFNLYLKSCFEVARQNYLNPVCYSGQENKVKEKHIREMQDFFKSAIEEIKLKIEENQNDDKEYYFSKNNQLSTQITLSKIISQAKDKLWVCDPFMGTIVIEEIVNNKNLKEVKFLTKEPNTLFEERFVAAVKQFRDMKIEVRYSLEIHDRYLILDQNDVWVMGNSYGEHLSIQPIYILSINELEIMQKFVKDFGAIWHDASTSKIK